MGTFRGQMNTTQREERAGFFSRLVSWLTPASTKVNPAWAGHISYSDMPQPTRMSRNYKVYVKEGYKDVDTIYKCVSYISRNGGAIEPKLYTDRTCQKELVKHPLLDKLRKPNNEQSGVAYREAILGFKLLAGNSFQYAIRPNKNGPPTELWPLRPDRMEILAAKNRGITGYRYEFFEEPIRSEDIAHTKYWNPDDDDQPGMGMSPLEAASLSADMLRDGKKWNLALLQNSARPPGAWSTPTMLNYNERERLEKKLNEKFAGYKNAGKFPVLDGGLTWQSMGLPPAQMEFLDLIKYNGGSVANVYNIPPQLIGDTSSTTYDNMDQAKQASYTEAIFPDLDDLYAMWNVWLLPMYPDLRNGAYLYYDKESVEVIGRMIQAQKDAKAERANKLWISGLLMQNEARALAGVEAHPQGKVFRIGQVLVPAEKFMEYAEKSVSPPPAPPIALPSPLVRDQEQENVLPDQDEEKQSLSSKGFDAHRVYQPDDLDSRLAKYRAEGVTHLEWQCGKVPCNVCVRNSGEIREIGKAFSNGLLLNPCHPNCRCQVVPSASSKKRTQRDEYRDFVEAVLV